MVEFLISDTDTDRSAFMGVKKSLCDQGIVTIACVRGNAAAGGVALAAACDLVIAATPITLYPAYRGMGLHGSEFHTSVHFLSPLSGRKLISNDRFSYLKRCGPRVAAQMLRKMIAMSVKEAVDCGLVDTRVGLACSTQEQIEIECLDIILDVLFADSGHLMQHAQHGFFKCAPWSAWNSVQKGAMPPRQPMPLTQFMSQNKSLYYRYRDFPALVHYRDEELSQMLLDCFHPTRSKRYHDRRYRFIRKVKAISTPSRYAPHTVPYVPDPEELPSFDDAPGHVRGSEWLWVHKNAPHSMETSISTRIDLWYKSPIASPTASLKKSGSSGEIKAEKKVSPTKKALIALRQILGANEPLALLPSTGQSGFTEEPAALADSLPTPPSSDKKAKTKKSRRGFSLLPTPPVSSNSLSPMASGDSSSSARPSTSGSIAKFRTFGRRVSGAVTAFSLTPDKAGPTLDVFGGSHAAVGKATLVGQPTAVAAQTLQPAFEVKYTAPVVEGPVDVEFPCLYARRLLSDLVEVPRDPGSPVPSPAAPFP